MKSDIAGVFPKFHEAKGWEDSFTTKSPDQDWWPQTPDTAKQFAANVSLEAHVVSRSAYSRACMNKCHDLTLILSFLVNIARHVPPGSLPLKYIYS